MKYLKITLNLKPLDESVRAQVLEELRTTTANEAFVHEGDLYLQVADENELIAEVFSLGMSAQALFSIGIDNPFDFELVQRQTLPTAVAMAMN